MKEDKGKTPLRIILHNFLNHIEKLEAHRSPEDSYEKEFQDLKHFSETLKGLKQYASGEGEKEVNRKKNRYKDILPFDFSRVILSEYAGTPGSDYINANYIKGASGSPAYIASQGPLPHTVNDFWRMVVECEVHVIIMACNQDEAGKHKCENYWVEREGEVKQFGMVKIRLIQGSTVCPDFSVRTMRLQYTNRESNPEERTVCQFHYSAWPDHGVPPSVRPLLDMVRLVRDTQASETLPVLVHCSAGCGRTGTICAIDYVWGLLRAGKLTKDFSLLTLVREMRRQRVAMVQTTEQYVLVHRAVRELFHEQLRVIDSHPYENIDLNGSLRTSPVLENGCPIETEDTSNEAPPLPRKNRPHIASSKYEKEVENQSQKERNSQSKQSSPSRPQSSPGRPRIAKLKAMFERSPIARSQSLGRQAAVNNALVTKSPPVLPIKRSKSMRILGYGERSKLSIAPAKSTPTTETDSETKAKASPPSGKTARQVRRRRSFEWNGTSSQPVRRSLHLEDARHRPDNLPGAVSIRERRDSFRQAVSQDASEARRERERIAAELRVRLSNPPARPMTPRRGPAKPPPPPPNPNVIIVKADRSSPKPADLYVKCLPAAPPTRSYHSLEREIPATASTSKTPLKKTNSSDNDLYARIGQMRRALTSLDLKSGKNLELPDAFKLRSSLQPETVNRNSVKVYESLDKMIRRDVEVRRPAAAPGGSKDQGARRPNSPMKDFYSSPRGGPSPQTDQYSSPRGGPSPQTEQYSSSQTELYSSPRGGPSPQADHYSSPRKAPSPQTELYAKAIPPQDRTERAPPAMYKESDGTSYGLVAGVSIRRGAQDDLALCAGIPLPPGPVAPPRVKRHASVVLLRHNVAPGVAEHSRGPATTPRRSEPKTTGYLKGPFNIDVDEIADNMRKYSAASPRTPSGLSPRPGAPLHLARPPNASSPAVPPPQGFQSDLRTRKPPQTQPSAPAPTHAHQPHSLPQSHSHQQLPQAMSSSQLPSAPVLSSLPTQHKHQSAPQHFLSPQSSQQQQQHRLLSAQLSQSNSPRPSGPPHMHLHPQWSQLKPPKQLYVQQSNTKGPQRQTHVHSSPARPGHHVHPPPYSNPQGPHLQSPAHPHSGVHQSHSMRGAPSQSYPSPLYQTAAQLREEPVKSPMKKQQYL